MKLYEQRTCVKMSQNQNGHCEKGFFPIILKLLQKIFPWIIFIRIYGREMENF